LTKTTRDRKFRVGKKTLKGTILKKTGSLLIKEKGREGKIAGKSFHSWERKEREIKDYTSAKRDL